MTITHTINVIIRYWWL